MAKEQEVERIAKTLDKMVHKKNTVSLSLLGGRSQVGLAEQGCCGGRVMPLCRHRTFWQATEMLAICFSGVLNFKTNKINN